MSAGAEAARLVPLGTGSILMQGGRSASSYLLESAGQRTLFDCGPGALLRLQQAGVDPATIDRVVLTHFHPDHHADLLGLLFWRANPHHEGLARCVLHAPTGLRRILEAWRSVYGEWVAHPDEDVVEFEPGEQELGVLRLHAHRAAHTMPAYCYRIETPCGLQLAYSGDSDACAGLDEACRGADFAWVECSFPDDDAVEAHLTPARIRDMVERVGPRNVALTHFYPPMFELLADESRLEALFDGLDCRLHVLHDLVPVELGELREGGAS